MNTKRDMVERIAENVGVTGQQAREIVQATLDSMIEALASNGRIELRNFGVFTVVKSKPRKARNPRTGETVMIGERFNVKFKMGKEMTERVRHQPCAS